MSQPLSIDRQRELLADLQQSIAERAELENHLQRQRDEALQAEERRYQKAADELVHRFQSVRLATQAEYDNVLRKAAARNEADSQTIDREFQTTRSRTIKRLTQEKTDAKQRLQESRWEAATLYEANKPRPRKELAAKKSKLSAVSRQADELREMGISWLKQRRMWSAKLENLSTEEVPSGQSDEDASVDGLLTVASEQLERLRAQRLPSIFSGSIPFFFVLLVWVIFAVACGFVMGWSSLNWLLISAGLALIATIALGLLCFPPARRQSAAVFEALHESLWQLKSVVRETAVHAEEECRNQEEGIRKRRDDAVSDAEEAYSHVKSTLEYQKQSVLQQADDTRHSRLAEAERNREQQRKEADAKYPRLLREIEARRGIEIEECERSHQQRLGQIQQHFKEHWNQLRQNWQTAIERFHAGVAEMHTREQQAFFDWEDSKEWVPPSQYPRAFKFGNLSVDLSRMRDGVPSDPSLTPEIMQATMPAVVPFPERPSVLLRCHDEGRTAAVAALQAMMLRLLTSIPPAQLRFTVIDPVGLGDNFSAFMHLADFDEKLITNNIWVESTHIEQRLADLTDHISSVIQKYLRSEFRTIQQYNEQAGEVAEPYRVLVVANFPSHFTEASARRLVSIANSGVRCGVFTLVSVDTKQQMPHNFSLEDLQSQAACLVWDGQQFQWPQRGLEGLPLQLDTPPEPEAMVKLIRTVGAVAEQAGRVEVPFDVVVPAENELWSLNAGAEIDVPLGRAGAAKLQHLRLGQGTSQHVLIAGKTGSGKSTLLHALITNAALYYSPDEVELYLVDFKKGVEFKAYATNNLPHARVIAIESEREFGLSVLQRLDKELQQRGDRFRELGVQDLKAFRAASSQERMPRIMLIVDEFQELFVEDDRLAQEASLLLDRLVRQGRAFGIHILLGSQTLAGAYSLARSTLGQMAVRVALQCSDADAHLILSEDNTAARLLSRPGEAIYNDANGLFEGNHPFQVVWLSDERRDHYLNVVREMAQTHAVDELECVVFEGNIPADIENNSHFQLASDDLEPPTSARTPTVWLGDAVAIKDPTSVEFARQGGSNLLVVGQQPEAALGMMMAAVVSLAVGKSAESELSNRLYILDGGRPDAVDSSKVFRAFTEAIPQNTSVVSPRSCRDSIFEVAEILKNRQEGDTQGESSIFVVIHDLARFRDLRKEEDDFSFSSLDEDKPASAAKQLADILREGAPLGIHVLVWCDSYNNLTRWLDRAVLREFELLVTLQMSPNDSSNLIDTPAASKLGVHRALLADLSQGRLEKFRPYGLPSIEWMKACGERLGARRSPAAD